MKHILNILKIKWVMCIMLVLSFTFSINFCQAYNIKFYAERNFDPEFKREITYWVTSVDAATGTVAWFK